jgi:hypothetical protein
LFAKDDASFCPHSFCFNSLFDLLFQQFDLPNPIVFSFYFVATWFGFAILAKSIWRLDLANHVTGPRFGKMVCQTILPVLELLEWFAKSIWHLDLANHFAGHRFA